MILVWCHTSSQKCLVWRIRVPDMDASPKHNIMAVIIYFFLIAGIEMIVQFFFIFFTVALHIYMYLMCIPIMSVFPLLLLTQRRGRAVGYVIELFILFMGNSQWWHYMLLSQILIGWHLLSQEFCRLIGWYWIIIKRQLLKLTYPIDDSAPKSRP